tara:strand:- start:72980 stop:73219 length:240 start_codon:yes stop_codon:yes gene_type:complete
MGINDFIKDNAKWLITLVFLAGGAFNKMETTQNKLEALETELTIVEERLGKKIKVINEFKAETNDLENRVIVLETTKCN